MLFVGTTRTMIFEADGIIQIFQIAYIMSLICLTEIKLFFLSTDYSFNPRRVGIQNIYRFGSDYNYTGSTPLT